MSSIKETKLAVPIELVRKSCGISLDMGGSVFKAIYRTQEDLDEANATNSPVGHMTLLAVAGDRIIEAVNHLASRSVIQHISSSSALAATAPCLVYTTGLGCSANRKLLASRLHIRVESMTEFDCFVKSFHYLSSHLSRAQLLQPFDKEAAQQPLARARKFVQCFQSMAEDGTSQMGGMDGSEKPAGEGSTVMSGETINDSPRPVAEVEGDLYPCVLAMCGSGFGYMKINSDGSFNFVDGSASGGRNFLGLGSLLTGAKTFDELLDLASRGSPRPVHMYAEELFEACKAPAAPGSEGQPAPGSGGQQANGLEDGAEEKEDPLYSRFSNAEGMMIYCFGKCVGKKLDDYSREDVARGLLEKTILDTVHLTILMCRLAGANRVFFAGSFFSHPLIRSLTTTELVSRNLFNAMIGQTPLKFDFLKPGPQMGAIGALIMHYEKHNNNNNNCNSSKNSQDNCK